MPGLLALLDEHASNVAQITLPLISGIGLGMLFHAPYQVFARGVEPGELATGTSAFFLVRFTGATVGLVRFIHRLRLTSTLIAMKAVAGAIFTARAFDRLPSQISQSSIDYSQLNSLEPLTFRWQTLSIVSSSIQVSCLP
jgi:hypothetical protein